MCPYIDEPTKRRLDDPNCRTRVSHARGPGQLTYKLQQLLKMYIEDHGLKYATLAECLGALEGAKIDLTERVIKPYEDRKRFENGDVWPDELTSTRYEGEEVPLTQEQIDRLETSNAYDG